MVIVSKNLRLNCARDILIANIYAFLEAVCNNLFALRCLSSGCDIRYCVN